MCYLIERAFDKFIYNADWYIKRKLNKVTTIADIWEWNEDYEDH